MDKLTEREFKAVQKEDGLWYIQYERFFYRSHRWYEVYFKDKDWNDISFLSKESAEDWITSYCKE